MEKILKKDHALLRIGQTKNFGQEKVEAQKVPLSHKSM